MVVALAQYRYDPSGKKYNCDITIAFCETEVGMKEDELIPVTKVDAHKETDKKGFWFIRGVLTEYHLNLYKYYGI